MTGEMATGKTTDVIQANKWQWLAAHLRFTACQSSPLDFADTVATCQFCGATFPRAGRAVNFIDGEIATEYHIDATDVVSDHPFDENALSIIEQLAASGGMILDCGSGLKTVSYPHVIQMEIVEYPLVDVLAVNQRLPFVDNSFDAIFSLDVLEHVDQPFVSAAEIARVLKSGGVLYIDLPFLQHEHGYPHHYFNATRRGLEQLFRDRLEVVAHLVPRSGQPIEVAHSVLSAYMNGLPPGQRERLAAMTVAELIGRTVPDWLDDPLVTHLDHDHRWMLASTTQALFRKPIGGDGEDTSQLIEAHSLPRFAAPEPYVAETVPPAAVPPMTIYHRGKRIARASAGRAVRRVLRRLQSHRSHL
ncbi:MAG: class I SAM-dependent methyltransferase [Actinobacteria bacterium]|nr:MAG: class I SAM-dependent methyltransferase [Actinomycetota bacterium]